MVDPGQCHGVTSHVLSLFVASSVNTFGHDEIMSLNTNGTPVRASTKIPYHSGTSSQRTGRSDEGQIIRGLEQEEKELNAFIISVRVSLLH
jgi:hypothetical protein